MSAPSGGAVERQPHLHVGPGDVGRFVFLPGDPARAEVIASRFDDARLVASHREFVTWSGHLDGHLVSVTSTGIGGPSAAIAVEELVKVGADTFIRVGTSGAVQPDIRTQSLGVLHGAIRDEGTTRHYLPIEFPAVADHTVTSALVRAAEGAALPTLVGVGHSKDSYFGQHEPSRMPLADQLTSRWHAWQRGGAICSEMEAAAIFVVAAVLGVRAGALVSIYPMLDGAPQVAAAEPTLDVLIDVAVKAMRELVNPTDSSLGG